MLHEGFSFLLRDRIRVVVGLLGENTECPIQSKKKKQKILERPWMLTLLTLQTPHMRRIISFPLSSLDRHGMTDLMFLPFGRTLPVSYIFIRPVVLKEYLKKS